MSGQGVASEQPASGQRAAGEQLASAQSALKEDKRQRTLLATLAGGSLALATDFACQTLSALVECSFRGSVFPTFPDEAVYLLCRTVKLKLCIMTQKDIDTAIA